MSVMTREWYMFLGRRDTEAAEADLQRIVRRLDDAQEAASLVLRMIAGCPQAEAEDALRIGYRSLSECMEYLEQALRDVRRGGPDVA